MKSRIWPIISGVTIFLLAGPVLAHSMVFHQAVVPAGGAHPLLGIDHLLAIVAAGLWAVHSGRRAG